MDEHLILPVIQYNIILRLKELYWFNLPYFQMSAITVGCLDAYKKSVDTTCDSVDSSIKVHVYKT